VESATRRWVVIGSATTGNRFGDPTIDHLEAPVIADQANGVSGHGIAQGLALEIPIVVQGSPLRTRAARGKIAMGPRPRVQHSRREAPGIKVR
jgi:hypothetical protein